MQQVLHFGGGHRWPHRTGFFLGVPTPGTAPDRVFWEEGPPVTAPDRFFFVKKIHGQTEPAHPGHPVDSPVSESKQGTGASGDL
jgi:hypothetical protein